MEKEIEKKVPSHVGIIMDGNGRWATLRGKNRSYGHKAGTNNVNRIVEHAFKCGVKTLSLYAFSSENWSRSKPEVDELMRLLKVYFTKYIKKIITHKVRLNVMGDLTKLTPEIQEILRKDMEETKNNRGHVLNIAINYGGRGEIVMAANKLVAEGKEITEQSLNENLYSYEFGDPDLIIRTGGELRLSNFMLYQGAYSELYFTDVLWPDFDENELDKAIQSFSLRKRRFGKV